jgi:glucose/arabinose dehydrogenase
MRDSARIVCDEDGTAVQARPRRLLFWLRVCRGLHGVVAAVLLAGILTIIPSSPAAAAPALARPQDRARFAVTTFASGLAFPTSMTPLVDGSLLIATSAGGPNSSLWSSGTGSLVRLVDADGDGVADGEPQVLATGLPGLLTSVRRVGSTVVALSSQEGNQAITLLQTGSWAGAPLSVVGTLRFAFPSGFEHTTYALAARAAPAGAGTEIYFNVGSKANAASTSPAETVGLSGSGVSFTASSLLADSIYRVRISDEDGLPVVSAPERIAAGLRNAAGMVFDTGGNLWLQDNGIDDPVDRSRSLSADEVNVVSAGELGVSVPNFGFATTYTDYATGVVIGPTQNVTLPVAAFLPLAGEKSEGAVELALAPAAFPTDFAGGGFVTFSGVYNAGGTANDENPVAFFDQGSGDYFHFIENQQMGHPNGLLATADALYLSDLSTTGGFYGSVEGIPADAAGAIYRITPVPEPASLGLALAAIAADAVFRRGTKRGRRALLKPSEGRGVQPARGG